jgi:hypothetical protein
MRTGHAIRRRSSIVYGSSLWISSVITYHSAGPISWNSRFPAVSVLQRQSRCMAYPGPRRGNCGGPLMAPAGREARWSCWRPLIAPRPRATGSYRLTGSRVWTPGGSVESDSGFARPGPSQSKTFRCCDKRYLTENWSRTRGCLTGLGSGKWLPSASRAGVRRRACSDHGANGSAGKTGS